LRSCENHCGLVCIATSKSFPNGLDKYGRRQHNRLEWLSRRVDHTALSRSVQASRGSTRAARKQLNSQRVDVTFPGKVRAERLRLRLGFWGRRWKLKCGRHVGGK
jgi:hypothetical protein